ncbi:MAG: hypothetical protein FWE12_04070 [Oscillospiraceae bacterium]|nr:hypothetical protein [Oscillospiraceae bacterium]
MNRTEHFGLGLPGQGDFYDVEVFNDNIRQIDAVLQSLLNAGDAKRLVATIMVSGTFRPADHGLLGASVDIYMVGGGGGAHASANLGHGGGGGFCRLVRNFVLSAASYAVTIGAGGAGISGNATASNGGVTSGFGFVTQGGSGASASLGGTGGSGGGGGASPDGGSGGDFGGAGHGRSGGSGSGSGGSTWDPVNPYDLIPYGCGGGGNGARGGGAGGRVQQGGHLGGGGGGGGGTGGRGGGGGGGNQGTTLGGRGGDGIVYIYATPQQFAPATAQGIAFYARTDNVSGVFAGPLTVAEIMECDALVKACAVNVGVLRDGMCIDSLAFLDIKTAEGFLAAGIWSDADAVVVLPEEYGIGDTFDSGSWTKQSVVEAVSDEGAGAV